LRAWCESDIAFNLFLSLPMPTQLARKCIRRQHEMPSSCPVILSNMSDWFLATGLKYNYEHMRP
jgi:hypothetical protein